MKSIVKPIIVALSVLLNTSLVFGASQVSPGRDRTADQTARYVILLIGDGMGVWHVDAAAKYHGAPLAMASLDHHGYMTTFMRNATDDRGPYRDEYWEDGSRNGSYDALQGGRTPWQRPTNSGYLTLKATDSAASASALFSGQKTVKYALNVDARPQGYAHHELSSIRYHTTIAEIAEAKGRATGMVTSVNFNHVTPAAAIVKTPYRKNYGEKARQIIVSGIDVIMGAGHPMFDDNGAARSPDYQSWSRNKGRYLKDADGKVLFDKVAGTFMERVFVETKPDFEDLADGDTRFRGLKLPERVFGLARVANTLQYKRAMNGGQGVHTDPPAGQSKLVDVPSLSVMTRGALAVLSQNKNGFWLMVEGGAIDWASHGNDMARMIEELLDFDEAVAAVVEWVNDKTNDAGWGNTLVIVTADHETGYLQPVGDQRGKDIIAHQCWGIDCAGWDEHTNSLVPIYAQGVGAEALEAAFDGDCRDNTDIFEIMVNALGR